MKITIGSDHAGFEHKSEITTFLEKNFSAQILDVGTFSADSVDYPDYAHAVAKEVVLGADFGILVCGSGNGVNMAANKHKKIRAALCWTKEIAKLARQHNNANVVSIPARFITIKRSKEIIKTFIESKFEGGRHQIRVEKI
jgi:ribose 5-phosphate isomerase B